MTRAARRLLAWLVAAALALLGAVALSASPVGAQPGDTPTANPQTVMAQENASTPITLTGSDPNGESLTYTTTQPSHGRVYPDSDPADGSHVEYEPGDGYVGHDSFTFTVTNSDGETSDPATVSVTVQEMSGCQRHKPTADVTHITDAMHANKLTVSGFTTHSAGELLVAFVEGNAARDGMQALSSVTGAGLTWQREANISDDNGVVAAYYAFATGVVRSKSITATFAEAGQAGSLEVVAYTGVGPNAVQQESQNEGPSGAPHDQYSTVYGPALTTAAGVGQGTTMRPVAGPGQTIRHQHVDTARKAAFWMQTVNNPAAGGGTLVTANDTQPTQDRWLLLMVEIDGMETCSAAP